MYDNINAPADIDNLTEQELDDIYGVAPVAEKDSTVRIGKSTLMMHVPGSKMYDNSIVLDDIDYEAFKPESETYVTVTHKEAWQIGMELINNVLGNQGVKVTKEHIVLAKGKTREGAQVLGGRMFGMAELNLVSGDRPDDFRAVFGMQNALDGSGRFVAGIGMCVFICDNTSFGGDLMTTHRHTKNIRKNIFGDLYNIISQAPDRFSSDVELIGKLKSHHLNKDQQYRCIAELVADDAFDTTKQIKAAMKHVRIPQYGVFVDDSSAWGVYNAATFGVKECASPMGVIGSTNKIDNYFRKLVGV